MMLPTRIGIAAPLLTCLLAAGATAGCGDDDDADGPDAGLDAGSGDGDTDSDTDTDTDADSDSDPGEPPDTDEMIWPFDISKIEWANIPDGGAADGGFAPSYEFFEGKVVVINCFQSW